MSSHREESDLSQTLKTVFGFIGQSIQKVTGLHWSGDRPQDVFNYLPFSDELVTSGQPSERQLVAISDAGYQTVINLAPTSKLENAVVNEREILEGFGVRYIHMPVDFENPTDEDFAQFAEHLARHRDTKLWVHCAANMRVSAFMYRHRIEIEGMAEPEARRDLERIWQPFGVWKTFIGESGRDE